MFVLVITQIDPEVRKIINDHNYTDKARFICYGLLALISPILVTLWIVNIIRSLFA
jgi:hypothetical protein